MTRVLFVDHSPVAGGATRVMLNLLELLAEGDVQPVVVCASGSRAIEETGNRGFRVHSCKMPWFTKNARPREFFGYMVSLLLAAVSIMRVARREKADVVHANTFIAALYCVIPSLFLRAPLVWHMHDILEAGTFNKVFIRLAAMASDRIICVSGAVRRNLESFGVAPAKCTVIHNSLPVKKDSERGGTLREELGLDRDTLLVGIIGFITRWKGQDVFLKAVPGVLDDFPDSRFVVIGDIMLESDREFKDELLRFVEDRGMGDRVTFTGFRKDVLNAMQDLDVVVQASVSPDPLPTVVLEAMSLGKPVLASDTGGASEMVEEGVNGFLLPPGDYAGLEDRMRTLVADRGLRERMGGESLRILREKFAPALNRDKVMDVYAGLIQGRKTRNRQA